MLKKYICCMLSFLLVFFNCLSVPKASSNYYRTPISEPFVSEHSAYFSYLTTSGNFGLFYFVCTSGSGTFADYPEAISGGSDISFFNPIGTKYITVRFEQTAPYFKTNCYVYKYNYNDATFQLFDFVVLASGTHEYNFVYDYTSLTSYVFKGGSISKPTSSTSLPLSFCPGIPNDLVIDWGYSPDSVMGVILNTNVNMSILLGSVLRNTDDIKLKLDSVNTNINNQIANDNKNFNNLFKKLETITTTITEADTSGIDDSNKNLGTSITDFDSVESGVVGNFSDSIVSLKTDITLLDNSDFIKTGTFVRQQLDFLFGIEPIGMITMFGLIIGIALSLIGFKINNK